MHIVLCQITNLWIENKTIKSNIMSCLQVFTGLITLSACHAVWIKCKWWLGGGVTLWFVCCHFTFTSNSRRAVVSYWHMSVFKVTLVSYWPMSVFKVTVVSYWPMSVFKVTLVSYWPMSVFKVTLVSYWHMSVFKVTLVSYWPMSVFKVTLVLA